MELETLCGLEFSNWLFRYPYPTLPSAPVMCQIGQNTSLLCIACAFFLLTCSRSSHKAVLADEATVQASAKNKRMKKLKSDVLPIQEPRENLEDEEKEEIVP